jgi:hypothetical protein
LWSPAESVASTLVSSAGASFALSRFATSDTAFSDGSAPREGTPPPTPPAWLSMARIMPVLAPKYSRPAKRARPAARFNVKAPVFAEADFATRGA